MKDRSWTTIPVLKYVNIEATLTFWEALGFKITYRIDRPYKYAVVESKGCQLHFYQDKRLDISAPDNGCLIMVGDIQRVHQEFSSRLRSKFGKVPSVGLPRISRIKPMQTRFTVTDPSGNAVLLISYGDKDKKEYEAEEKIGLTELGKSIALAIRLRDFKEDYLSAARTLDNAFKKPLDDANKDEQAEGLIIRAELARVLNDEDRETQCYGLLEVLEIPAEKILELKLKHLWTS